MARVKGHVAPYQAGRVPLQRALNRGRWNMEFEIVKDGKFVGQGNFQSGANGTFDINVDAPENSTVRIRALGGWGYETDEASIHISSDRDVVECRPLNMREK